MTTTKILISLPATLKSKLDAVRKQGFTVSGLIRHLLSQHFEQPENRQKGKAHADKREK